MARRLLHKKTFSFTEGFCFSAETARFELAIRFPVYTLSRRAPSTTRTRLQLKYNSFEISVFCL